MNNGIVQGSAKYILLDRTLARYGPETKAIREQMKLSLATGIEMVWPNQKTDVPALAAFERGNGLEIVQDKLSELTRHNPMSSDAHLPRRSNSSMILAKLGGS